MTRAHVGLGSNLGDRMAILDTAVRVLDADEAGPSRAPT
jgi:7,8-dihydro-6-hydroxymethylpterin-pyrophosphokinase